MKKIILTVLAISSCLSAGFGQTDCKVLKAEIGLIYKGECKNGLAHGMGEAAGRDNYFGNFRKGLPHGEGTYTWVTGEVYEGSWKKGKRHGYGIYMYIAEGQDSILQGNWVNDEYKGMEESDGVRVLMKRDISRFKSIRRGDGNQVLVKIVSTGMTDSSIEEFMFLNSSGNQIRMYNATGYENIEFPFWGKITYSFWNRTKTARLTVLFEFEILKPGIWEISLYN